MHSRPGQILKSQIRLCIPSIQELTPLSTIFSSPLVHYTGNHNAAKHRWDSMALTAFSISSWMSRESKEFCKNVTKHSFFSTSPRRSKHLQLHQVKTETAVSSHPSRAEKGHNRYLLGISRDLPLVIITQ